VLRPGALGDAVLTLPLLAALRREGFGRLTVAGTPASWGFLAPSAAIAVEDAGGLGWLGLFGAARPLPAAAAADLAVLCLADAAGPAAALRRAGVAAMRIASPPPGGARASDGDGRHVACRLAAAAAAPAGPEEAAALLRPAAARVAAAQARAGLPAGGYVVLHPGSGGRRKCWPVERFARLAAGLERPAVALFGPAEADLEEPFRAALGGGACRILAGWPLAEATALLAGAAACVANDSGIGHVAARLTPTLSLFGPTDPTLWRPLGARTAVLEAPEGDLDRLPAERVAAALAGLLAPG